MNARAFYLKTVFLNPVFYNAFAPCVAHHLYYFQGILGLLPVFFHIARRY
jgi:hypothetical protein